MKCRDFELSVPILARKRFVDADLERVLAHAKSCDRCATRLVQERTLAYGVRAVMADLADDEPSPRVETALLLAFNAHSAREVSSPLLSTFARKQPRLHFSLGFVFAIFLILISVPSIFWLRSPSMTRVPDAISQVVLAPSVIPDRGEEVRKHPGTETSRRQKRVRASVGKQLNVIEPNVTEEVTEFYPLADGEDLTSLEAAQVARVELPVSALMELGLRVGPEISAGQVKADILLGHDGSARAIRFVR